MNSVVHCCLVKGGKQDIVALRPVLEWNLNNIGDGTCMSCQGWGVIFAAHL